MRGRGFTLIEVALILVVVGLVSSFAVRVVGSFGESDKVTLTNKRMTLVQKALQVYVIQNGCLPCPANGALLGSAVGAGVARDTVGFVATPCTSNACITADAVVPWTTLGLAEEDALDGWKDRLRYRTTAGVSCAGGNGVQSTDGMKACSLTSKPAGGMLVNNLETGVDAENAGQPAAYALISSGSDRSLALPSSGALTANVYGQAGTDGQFLNANGGATFAAGGKPFSGTTHFDDLVRYLSVPVMIQGCGPGACGNPNAN